MAFALDACQLEPNRGGLPWSERVPQAVGLFTVGVATIIAVQRHEFTSPNWGLVVIIAMTLPWILDIFGWPKSILRSQHLALTGSIVWCVVVLAGTYWLSVSIRESDDFSPFFITILVGQMTATVGPKFGAIIWGIGIAGLITLANVNHFHGMAIWGFAFTIGWMGGAAFRRQVQVAFELSEAQTQLSEQAAADERHRLARDIHDLIAHSLAVTMLQLTGARLALKAGDTDEALAALEDAEAAGRAAMAEIHRTVGLLGSNDGASDHFPTPNALEIPNLIETFRRAGLTIDVDVFGDLHRVPMACGLASYRVVQESLSNVVKHAPAEPIRLRINVHDDDITLEATNQVKVTVGARVSKGNGLRGMTERAELLGGSVVASEVDGTWRVSARIPWEHATS